MKKIEDFTKMDFFDMLIGIASRGGRGKKFFGDLTKIRKVFEKTFVGSNFPHLYLEFPLLGEPRTDILIQAEIEKGEKFAEKNFVFQPMFDWFSTICEDKNISCGIEIDTAEGKTEKTGAYFQFRKRTDLILPFFETIGASKRFSEYIKFFEKMPEGWDSEYIGIFLQRENSPIRIGGYMSAEEIKNCAKNPEHLKECFNKIEFFGYNDEMLTNCAEIMKISPGIEFQFDIMPDGNLSYIFGLSTSFNEVLPKNVNECMESGFGNKIMKKYESLGVADKRWKNISGTTRAKYIPLSTGKLLVVVRFCYSKIKFKAGEAKISKFYLYANVKKI